MDANCFKASLAGQKTTAYLVNMVSSGGAEVDGGGGGLRFFLPINLLLDGVPLWKPVRPNSTCAKRHKDCWHEQLTHWKRPFGKDWRQKEKTVTVRWLGGITDSMDMNLGKLWEMLRVREAWRAAVHRVVKSWTWLAAEQQHKNSATLCIGHLTSTLQKRLRINDSRTFWERGQTTF